MPLASSIADSAEKWPPLPTQKIPAVIREKSRTPIRCGTTQRVYTCGLSGLSFWLVQ